MKKILIILALLPAFAPAGIYAGNLPFAVLNTSSTVTGAAAAGITGAAAAGITGTAAAGITGTAAAGITGTAAAGITKTAAAGVTTAASADEGEAAYISLTSTADFNYRPEYDKMKYEKNFPLQDIAVSAVEAVPFGFLFTFAGIFLSEAYTQKTWSPKLKSVNDYTGIYEIFISAFAAINIGVNMAFYYDYKKENKNAEKTEKK